ncbi:hypothetical protein ABIE65_004501 [Constrictibacter sp. MBR-5]|uniref:PqqD family protein n=1 Tax=Constrictibacter sp. MBR-5 TaxID=3156467 RepID=UPI00339651EB
MTSLAYRQADGVLSAELDGETVMISQETGRYHGLRGSAGLLWDRLETPCGIGDLADALVRRYGLQEGEALDHSKRFVDGLLQRRLIVRVSGAAD